MTTINQDRLLEEFLRLAQIDSPTLKEGKLSSYLQEQLKALGCDFEIDDAGEKTGGDTGNIIARFPGNNPLATKVMFGAHMDCVPPCEGVKPVVEGTIIKSSGDTILGGDDKAGIAVILELLRTLKDNDIQHGDMEILFDIAEEGGLHGVKNLDLTKFRADIGYCLDSDNVEEITVRAAGAYRLEYTVKGKASHAGVAPEKGISAIMVASRAIGKMKLGKIDEESTANVGVIEGGSATNIITPEVFIKAEARSQNPQKLEKQVAAMRDAFDSVLDEFSITVEGKVYIPVVEEKRMKDYPPMVVEETSPAYVIASRAGKSMGITMKPVTSGGGTDANILNMGGMEVCVLGVGMQKVHTTEEFIDLKDMVKSCQLLLQIVSECNNPL